MIYPNINRQIHHPPPKYGTDSRQPHIRSIHTPLTFLGYSPSGCLLPSAISLLHPHPPPLCPHALHHHSSRHYKIFAHQLRLLLTPSFLHTPNQTDDPFLQRISLRSSHTIAASTSLGMCVDFWRSSALASRLTSTSSSQMTTQSGLRDSIRPSSSDPVSIPVHPKRPPPILPVERRCVAVDLALSSPANLATVHAERTT